MSSDVRHAADRIHSASIHVLRRVSREDAAAGVSAARLSALSVLVFGGARTVSELAAAERVKVPTMSRLVAAMEAEGLVRRVPHGSDARAVVLHATAKGRRVLGRARELRLSLLESLLAGASPREVEVVREAAEIIDRLVR
ncbi:MAG TPA: MarR family transcriptional regulator [Gaiellaceae bacterium]|jgi:DNA-binding MarR family transcriptional regulator|nr:MarR family transcriptional regulator [Gaiellaceae bacterium]